MVLREFIEKTHPNRRDILEDENYFFVRHFFEHFTVKTYVYSKKERRLVFVDRISMPLSAYPKVIVERFEAHKAQEELKLLKGLLNVR